MSRADVARLAALLERDLDAEGASAAPEEHQLLTLASALRDAAPPVPPMREDFRAELRQRVVAAAREQQAEPALLTRLRDRVHRARYSTGFATGTGIAAMALSGGGVAAAAEGAAPGDALYGTKIAIEDARLALTFDDVAAGRRAVAYSHDRIAEAEAAAAAGDDAGAATALRGAAERIQRGTDHLVAAGLLDPLLELADDVAAQAVRLDALRPELEGVGLMALSELEAALDAARDAIVDAVAPGTEVPGVPTLPDLAVPTQTTTPAPAATAAPTASATATPAPPVVADPTPTPILPGLPTILPTLPDLPLPLPGPGGGTTGPLPGPSGGIGPVEEAVDTTTGAVGEALEDTVEAVVEPVAPAVPAPVQTAVEALPDVVDDAVEDTVDGVGGAVGSVGPTVGGVTQGVEDVTSGLLGGS